MRHPNSLHLSAAALVCLFAAPVHADTVQFLGYAHGSVGVNYQLIGLQPTSGSTGAGGFVTKLNGVDPTFTTYCIDLYQYIGFNQPPYDPYANVPASAHTFRNANAGVDLARLYSSGRVVNDALTEAAFQIAVWEIAYETTGSYNVAAGDALFTGAGADTVTALGLAENWLQHLGTGNGVNVRVLESGTYQDELFATPIPEPGTVALSFAALGLMAGVMRRRRDRMTSFGG
jgi:PEP-CTERM motif-containing protein